ncbi:MAG: preprotein translocase subunit SecG [Chlorobi bacterium]|nr:preprotein translocase subunit SecG [Chlorobiota bacterium]
MYTFLAILVVIASILLIAVVLIQNPKEGGLSAGFGAGFSQQVFGIQQTADVLEKATWSIMGFIAAMAIVMYFVLPNQSQQTLPEPVVPTTTQMPATNIPLQGPATNQQGQQPTQQSVQQGKGQQPLPQQGQ